MRRLCLSCVVAIMVTVLGSSSFAEATYINNSYVPMTVIETDWNKLIPVTEVLPLIGGTVTYDGIENCVIVSYKGHTIKNSS